MRRRSLTLLIGLTTAVIGVGAATAVAGATGHSASAPRAKVSVQSSRYGRIVFDGHGQVLYLFARDRGAKSTCYGACAKAWPPFLTKARPSAGSGARAGLLGTTRRRDGSLQVTYAGYPLYYFTGDTRPGQINCQNVSQFGAKWLVLSAAGKAVH